MPATPQSHPLSSSVFSSSVSLFFFSLFFFSLNILLLFCRWHGTAALLDSLVSCLEASQTPTDPSPSPHPPPLHPPTDLANGSKQQFQPHSSAAHTHLDSPPKQHSVHAIPRQGLLVLATLLQQREYGVLGHLVRLGQGSSEGALCPCLLEMVDAVTRGPPGRQLSSDCLQTQVFHLSFMSKPLYANLFRMICHPPARCSTTAMPAKCGFDQAFPEHVYNLAADCHFKLL